MKLTILSVLVFLFIFPLVFAGSIYVYPNPVESGNNITITMYASPGAPMECAAVMSSGGSLIDYFEFNCDEHCRCYSPVSKNYYVNSSIMGDYSVGVFDLSKGDFSYASFHVNPNSCLDHIKDNDESDIDCGGKKCNKCDNEKTCLIDDDCKSGFCNSDNKCRNFSSMRDLNKYPDGEVFIISDKNWEDVLKIVPLSIWNENSKKIKYPVLIYHEEVKNVFDFDSGIHFIQSYSPDNVTIFGESPEKLDKLLITQKDLGAGLSKEQIKKVSLNDYYSYWNEINEVVVSSNDYETGLMASVFASYENAPLMFEDEISYSVLAGKRVYIIGDVDSKIVKNIQNISNETYVYSDLELQKKYINLTGTDKAIVVNTNDLGIKLDTPFRTDKGSKIKEIYNKNSLAAPFLAAGREENIISVNAPASPENSNCKSSINIVNNVKIVKDSVKKQVDDINWKPKYLTIIASPNSIPDSVYDKCQSGEQYRNSTDYDYASFRNETLNYGRIYGIDIADTSSYIARDIFYDKLKEEIYNKSTGISIGHSFESHIDNAEKIHNLSTNSGYDSTCYTGEKRDGCVKQNNVPLSEYSEKQFIIFGDHGFSNQWYETLKSNKVPELHLSYVFAHACSTNNFWEGKEKLMSSKMIRKGAMSYQGAVGISYVDNSELAAIKMLTSSNLSLGELNEELTSNYMFYKRDYSLIGDPALKLGLKSIDWNDTDKYEGNDTEFIYLDSSGKINSADSNKQNYYPDDKIIIETDVKNNKNSSEELLLEYNIYSLNEKYNSELVLEKVNLSPDEEKEVNFTMDVTPTMPSGSYEAQIRLLNGENKLDEKDILFDVNGTLKTMEVTLKSCEDKDCKSEAKIFGKNETIYLDYENPDSANTFFTLIHPDKSQENINLPYEINSNSIGNYKLLVNSSKADYQNYNDEIIFGISEDANLSINEICNLDAICNNNESMQNCPQDCIKVNISEENNSGEDNETRQENKTDINRHNPYTFDKYEDNHLDGQKLVQTPRISISNNVISDEYVTKDNLNEVIKKKSTIFDANVNDILIIIIVFILIYITLIISLLIIKKNKNFSRKKRDRKD